MKRALFKVIMLSLKIISIVIESLSSLYQETFGQKVQKKKYILLDILSKGGEVRTGWLL